MISEPIYVRKVNPSSNSMQRSMKNVTIAGGIIGALLILFLLVFLCMFIYEYRKGLWLYRHYIWSTFWQVQRLAFKIILEETPTLARSLRTPFSRQCRLVWGAFLIERRQTGFLDKKMGFFLKDVKNAEARCADLLCQTSRHDIIPSVYPIKSIFQWASLGFLKLQLPWLDNHFWTTCLFST